jgi:hypothetical protein
MLQQRERILLLVVAGLLVALVGVWGASRAVATMRDRQNELNRRTAMAEQEDVRQAELDALGLRLTRLAERSLPRDAEAAKHEYSTWLTGLTKDPAVNFSATNVQSLEAVPDKEHGFTRLRFQVDGQGTYPQLVRFLEKFYAADHLHKITLLRLPQTKDLNKLPISITIEALSLRDKKKSEGLSTRPSLENPPEELQAHVEQLMRRHFFRANRTPQLGVPSFVTARTDRPVNVPLKGADPDNDKFTYQLVSGPSWLKLEGGALSSRGNPPQGAHEVTVTITDDGLPAKSETKKFTLRVDPPPKTQPPKAFDHTKFAFVEGLLERRGEAEAWLTVRTTGDYHTLHVGSEIDVRGVKVKVLAIDLDARTIEVQLGDGRPRTVPLGKSLAE